MKLYAHQASGAAWMAARPKSLLGDTPGLGKTYTAIQALKLKDVRRPLIVCPAIARTHWRRTFEAFGPTPWAEIASFEGIVAEGMPGMARRLTGPYPIDSLVIDEFHYCKTSTAQRAQLLLGNNGYARRLEHVIGLSGSIPKHPGEYFNVLVCLFPEVLVEYKVPTRELFMDRYTVRMGRMVRGHWAEKVVGQKNIPELQEILSRTLLKRTLEDAGLDVPEVWWQTVMLDGGDFVTDDDAPIRRRAEIDGELAKIADYPHVASMRRRLGELKAPAVVKMLHAQLDGTDEKVVVFAHHRSVLAALKKGLQGYGVAYVDGDTTPCHRDQAIDDFQRKRATRIFLGQNIACRYSLTLTAAHRAILVEPDWSADTNYQLGQRIARIGSTAKHCVGQMIALAGTLDEAIVRQNTRETRMAADLFSKEAGVNQ